MIGSLRDEQTKGWQRFGVIYNKKGKRGRDGGEYVMWSKLVVCDVNVRAQRKRRAFGVYVNAHLCSTVAPSVTLPQVVHTWCNKYKISCVILFPPFIVFRCAMQLNSHGCTEVTVGQPPPGVQPTLAAPPPETMKQ